MHVHWIESWRNGSAALLHGLEFWLHPRTRAENGPENDWLGWDGWVRPSRAGDDRA